MKARLLSLLRRVEERPMQQYRRDLRLIVIAGVLFKLILLWIQVGPLGIYDQSTFFGVYVPDSGSYYGPAVTLAQSFTYHSTDRTPGYPAFLALIYFLTRDPNPTSNLNLATVFAVQSLLITLGCLPLAGAIRRLTGFQSLAIVGACLWAFDNSARFYAAWVLSDALAATLVCCLAYAIVRALKDGEPTRADGCAAGSPGSKEAGAMRTGRKVSLFWFAVTGAVMFALTLVRPSCSLLAIPVGGAMLYAHFGLYRRRRQWLAMAALLLALPFASQTLWALRNYLVEGQWYYCELSTFGVYAYGVEIPIQLSTGKAWMPAHDAVWSDYERKLISLSPRAVDRVFRRRAWSEFKKHPGVVITSYLASIPYLFTPTVPLVPYGITPPVSEWAGLPWQWRGIDVFLLLNSIFEFVTTCGLLAMMVTGLLSWRRQSDLAQKGAFVTALLAVIYWILVHTISDRYTGFLGGSRFFFPIIPVLILAAAGVAAGMPGILSIRPDPEAAEWTTLALAQP